MERRGGSLFATGRVCVSPLLFLTGLLLVAGCSRSGDFGRNGTPRELSTVDPAVTGGISVSSFNLTDDERHLRDLARGLIAGPNQPSRALFVVSPPLNGAAAAERYVHDLVNGPYRSVVARYSRLIDDTRNDMLRLEPFFLVARRVADLDMKRERSLPHVSELSQEEALNAHRRVRENMMLIAEVHRIMIERTQIYRRALERLVIALPSPLAVEAERQRLELERRLAQIRIFADGPAKAVPQATVSK